MAFPFFQKGGCRSPLQDNLFDTGIEGETTVAPYPQKVPPTIVFGLFTINTNDIDDARQVGRYRLTGNAHGECGPCRRHIFGILRCFLAHGTSRIVGNKILETMPMNGVTTGHFVGSKATAEQIFLTDRTIAHVFAGFAIVIIE